jgi:MoaA/NifB/PqqE/SkfB family radical SAM enzyme
VNSRHLFRTWGSILAGRRPLLSIEITRECPLRCPGCYAYEDNHVGEGINLRQLADKKGEALVQEVLRVVDQYRPLHLSIVGGDPLVRFRELEVLLPLLESRGLPVQLVTSAFREIPKSWSQLRNLTIAVSVDGLQPEHDVRRKPATYERILKNIQGHSVTIHCTVTAQMVQRPGYLDEFLEFWSAIQEARRVWISFFTPQRGASEPEILSPEQRLQAVRDLLRLRELYPKLDMGHALIREFLHPPSSPEECIFAQTTDVVSADLTTKILPCQFGGDPDCSQCGCMASMGLASVGHLRLVPGVSVANVLQASRKIGSALKMMTGRRQLERPESSRPMQISLQKDAWPADNVRKFPDHPAYPTAEARKTDVEREIRPT